MPPRKSHFTDEQLKRLGSPECQKLAVSMMNRHALKLHTLGWSNDELVDIMSMMPQSSIDKMTVWKEMMPIQREIRDAKKTYLAWSAGLSASNIDSIKSLSKEELQVMARVRSL